MNKVTVAPNLVKWWMNHRTEWDSCKRCPLHRSAFYHVLGRGVLPADVLFVGIGPGKTEDVTGIPFEGIAGKVLDDWIRLAGLSNNYLITNLVACRPTDFAGGPNRDPFPDEIEQCTPRLTGLIEKAEPKAVILLGRQVQVAATRIKWPNGVGFLSLYHPAYIARRGGIGCGFHVEEATKLKMFIESRGLGSCT